MNLDIIKQMPNNILKFTDKNKPEILLGLGLAGLIGSTIMAVSSTPKAMQLIEEKKDELDVDVLTPKEIVTTTWKCYVIPTALTIASAGLVLYSHKVQADRMGAIFTAYTLSEAALNKQQDKMLDLLGKKKTEAVHDAVAQDKINETPVPKEVVPSTDTVQNGTLFFDCMTSRWFTSDMESIKRAVNNANSTLLDEGTVTLNDLYYQIGIESIKLGDQLCWVYNDKNSKINISYRPLLKDDKPCIFLDYNVNNVKGGF